MSDDSSKKPESAEATPEVQPKQEAEAKAPASEEAAAAAPAEAAAARAEETAPAAEATETSESKAEEATASSDETVSAEAAPEAEAAPADETASGDEAAPAAEATEASADEAAESAKSESVASAPAPAALPPRKTYSQLISDIETPQLRKLADFSVGDTVSVQVRVIEGERQRIQSFNGVVIAKRNRGLNSSFRVRKKSRDESVERVFQTHSPIIESVKVKTRGRVRRAKLYYLRKLSGLAARIEEKFK